ncbi:MAG: alanine racemase [Bacteroidota bacterium]
MKQKIKDLSTPAVLIEKKVLVRNIKTMQQKADCNGLHVYPHIKTHKSIYLAALQVKYGAKGLTAAKITEALPFIKAGFPSVIIAYPLVEKQKIVRLLKVAQRHQCQLQLIIDSSAAFQALAFALEKIKYPVRVSLKIDVGLHRCGFAPRDPHLVQMARQILEHPRMELFSLLSHAGHCYGAKHQSAVQQIAEEELNQLKAIRKQLVKAGLPQLSFSIGATPTLLSRTKFPKQVHSIRPGNYIFMDRTPLRLNLIKPTAIALTVLATVISANADFWILNVGSKQLSSDTGAHGIQGMEGFGLAYPEHDFLTKDTDLLIEKLSEEHAFLRKRPGVKLTIGQRLRILPNHSCVVMNLAKKWYLTKGSEVLQEMEG